MVAPTTASPLAIGEIVAGKYRVENVLGRGAMGIVVGARHVTLDRVVAIKVLVDRRGAREESIARFLAEARAAARIDSDHVARVFDVGTLASGAPYMVMEHLDGNDLELELERRGRLPIAEAVEWVLQAADAISAAHQLGIVHRDLKPANLFLARRKDGSRRLKVLDFGISKTGAGAHAADRASVGTPAYMSPEQVREPGRVDARSDVWALGAILYELVTGQMAFVGPTVSAVFESILEDDPCPMTALRRDVPPELETIVRRCLDRDRDGRWPSAAALVRALVPFGTSSVAVQPSVPFVAAAPSLQPVVASVLRDTIPTEPDPDELHAPDAVLERWAALRERRRAAQSAVLGVLAAALVFGAVAIVSWEAAPRRALVERSTAAPAPAMNVYDAPKYVYPATSSPEGALRPKAASSSDVSPERDH